MCKVLIIEDDEDLALVMRRNLTSRGMQALVAYDGVQGTQVAHTEKPDLIILDLNLPGGGGERILKNLVLSTHTNTIPVIIMTGSSDEAVRHRALAEGAAAFMQKPYDLDELIETIHRILGR